jgi:hypothetical protein
MTSATGKPTTMTVAKTFTTQPGASKVGTRIDPPWIKSHLVAA